VETWRNEVDAAPGPIVHYATASHAEDPRLSLSTVSNVPRERFPLDQGESLLRGLNLAGKTRISARNAGSHIVAERAARA